MGCEGETPRACHFALVSYIPGPPGDGFWIVCGSNSSLAVYSGPTSPCCRPRPIDLNIDESIRQIKAEATICTPFTVELGSVADFR